MASTTTFLSDLVYNEFQKIKTVRITPTRDPDRYSPNEAVCDVQVGRIEDRVELWTNQPLQFKVIREQWLRPLWFTGFDVFDQGGRLLVRTKENVHLRGGDSLSIADGFRFTLVNS